jgi:hypothetical protein
MLPQQKLDALVARHKAVESELASQLTPETYVKLSREFAELGPVVDAVKSYRGVVSEIEGLDALIADPRPMPILRAMANAESSSSSGLAREIKLRSRLRMRWTSAMSSSKSAPGPAATRRRVRGRPVPHVRARVCGQAGLENRGDDRERRYQGRIAKSWPRSAGAGRSPSSSSNRRTSRPARPRH